MIEFELLDPRMRQKYLGDIPYWFSESNPKSAAQQINDGYRFGGWQPFHGFKLLSDNRLKYPGDPPRRPVAQAKLRDELLIFYESEWLAIIQPDRSFEVCRID